jgi:hypothetical protein
VLQCRYCHKQTLLAPTDDAVAAALKLLGEAKVRSLLLNVSAFRCASTTCYILHGPQVCSVHSVSTIRWFPLVK